MVVSSQILCPYAGKLREINIKDILLNVSMLRTPRSPAEVLLRTGKCLEDMGYLHGGQSKLVHISRWTARPQHIISHIQSGGQRVFTIREWVFIAGLVIGPPF
jgi:hypothetical protein